MRKTSKVKDLFTATIHSTLFLFMVVIIGLSVPAQAAFQAPITGEIMKITLANPADVYSRGTIEVGGQSVIIPANMVMDLPANRLTLQQFFTEAPPECILTGETGLAKEDVCNASLTGASASILANLTNNGNIIAGDVFIDKAVESVLGSVTYIDHTDGYLRVNGAVGDPNTGAMVRINDPSARFTIQQGLGVAPGNTTNGSADPRFGVDPDNYTTVFSTGYPACIPSTVTGVGNRTIGSDANGVGDEFCPATNRTGSDIPADAFKFAPIQVGDHISAEGNFEIIDGVQFLSAHTLIVHQALLTVDGQPDYLIFDEVEWDVAGFQNERIRTLFIGFSSRGDSLVDLFALHIDPETGLESETPIASTLGCDAAAGAGTCTAQGIGVTAPGIFKIRYDVDFIAGVPINARLSPCAHLLAANLGAIGQAVPDQCLGGVTIGDEFSVISPISRDLIGRSRNKLLGNAGGPFGDSMDILGLASPNGEYLNPVGIGHPEFVEINLNAIQTPLIFAGQPWSLDRRLGPGGLEGANPGTPQPLDPFPFSDLDPRAQTIPPLTTLLGTAAADRIFAFVSDASVTPPVLGGTLAWPPADPAAEPIVATIPVELVCPVVPPPPPPVDEIVAVFRAEFSTALGSLSIAATSNVSDTETLTVNWGNGSGVLNFRNLQANGLFRYNNRFRNLPVAPGPNVTVTSGQGVTATLAITVLP